MLRSKSSNLNVIKLSRKSPINSLNNPTQPKCLITTHYIGNLENKFGMFTREQTPRFGFPSRDQIILKFTNSKLNSLVHSPKTNIKYQEIPIQDATNTGIDKFLQSINFSFQTNLNLFHSCSLRNVNDSSLLQAVRDKDRERDKNNNNQLQFQLQLQPNKPIENKKKQLNKKPYTAKMNIINKPNKSKDTKVNYYKLKASKVILSQADRQIEKRETHQLLPAIDKKMMFRKRNYTQSNLCSFYSLFYLNNPNNQKRIGENEQLNNKQIRIFDKSKYDVMHHNTELPL